MANHYFQFKQFTINQEDCAMKVCTDACLFGAYVADIINTKYISANKILDIGTGTGLLSLLLAQKTNAEIDAVEIDTAASLQATVNFNQSPWNERLTIFNTDIQQFEPGKKYDLIISNPPFFEGGLKSNDQNKNAAKHDTTLTLQQLLKTAEKLLDGDGLFAVLIPYQRIYECTQTAVKLNLFCNTKVLVKQTTKHNYFRAILLFSSRPSQVSEEEINIKNEVEKYSDRFTSLLKDYYLYL